MKIILMFVLFISGCIGPTPTYMLIKYDKFPFFSERKCVESGINKVAKIVKVEVKNNYKNVEYIYTTENSDYRKSLVVYVNENNEIAFNHNANFPLSIGANKLSEEKIYMSLVAENVSTECEIELSDFR